MPQNNKNLTHTDSMYNKANLPTVAIVGKPNVGKSSLFNRLVKSRKAIVFDEPGVTRDINYEVVHYYDLTYRLADSTGYFSEKDETGSLAREMNRRLIEEATLILFTGDIKDLSRLDYDIAEQIRKSGKPYIFVLNKVDNDKLLDNMYDFFDLGLEEPVTESAIHGKNVSILQERIVENLENYGSYTDEILKKSFPGGDFRPSFLQKYLSEIQREVTRTNHPILSKPNSRSTLYAVKGDTDSLFIMLHESADLREYQLFLMLQHPILVMLAVLI